MAYFKKTIDISNFYPYKGEKTDTPYATIIIDTPQLSEALSALYEIRNLITYNKDYILLSLINDALQRNDNIIDDFVDDDGNISLEKLSNSVNNNEWITVDFPCILKNSDSSAKDFKKIKAKVRAPGYDCIVTTIGIALQDEEMEKLIQKVLPKNDEWDNYDFKKGKFIKQ